MARLLGARFACPALEAAYRDFCVSHRFLKDDPALAAVPAFMIAAAVARAVMREGLNLRTAGLLALLSGPMAQILLALWSAPRARDRASRGRFYRRRTAVICLFRGLCVPLASFLIPSLFPPPAEGATISWAVYCVIVSGIASLAVVTLASSLVLETHVPLHALTVCLMIRFRGPEFCAQTVASATGAGGALAAWRWLDGSTRAVLATMYSCFQTPHGEVDDSFLARGELPGAEEACMQLFAQAHISLGLVGLTYIVWHLERRSRAGFVQRTGVVLEGAGVAWWGPQGGWALAMHTALAPIWFSVCWRLAGGWALAGGCRGEGQENGAGEHVLSHMGL